MPKTNPIKKESVVKASATARLSTHVRQTVFRYSRQIALALALAISGAGLAHSQDLATRANQTAYGGRIGVPLKQGDFVYLPTGSTVTAWDYRIPEAPRLAGDTRRQPLAGVITAIASRGRYLYASWQRGGSSSGLAIYSLLDPGQPRLIDGGLLRKSASPENITAISIDGDFLYAFDSERGVVVHSLADPLYPKAIRVVEGGPADVVGMAGNRIFTSGRSWVGDTLLQVFDNSRKNYPKRVASENLDGFENFRLQFAWPLAVGFGLSVNLYYLPPWGGPPLLWGSAAPGEALFNGFIAGDKAYGFGASGVSVWSLRLPVRRVGRADFANAFATETTTVQGQFGWVATTTDQLALFDTGKTASPRLASVVDTLGGADVRDAALIDRSLVLLQNVYGLSAANDGDLTPTGRFDADLPKAKQARAFEDMAVDGRRAYLAAWGYGLIVVDLSNPSSPRELGRLPAEFSSAVAGKGRHVYLGTATNGGSVTSVDVSNPARPVVRDAVPVDTRVERLQLAGRFLFAASAPDAAGGPPGGLRVFDVGNPSQISEIGRYSEDCEFASDLAVSDDARTVHLRCSSGLHILDVSQPSRPVRIGFYAASQGDRAIALGSGSVFVAADGSVEEIDVRNPRRPTLLNRYQLPAEARRLRVMPGRRLFVFTGTGGMQIIKL
ncbi:hypothetical protein QFZ27_002578 [Inquilinus ginsengisoli]|uniref:hypothetical protein n=1 Tax=Inquilinus ginsengisoli TaxID=363840 RepID=UPI003D243888